MHGEGPSLLGVHSLLPSINLSSEEVHSEEVRFVRCGQKHGPSLHAQSGRHKQQQTLQSKNGYPGQRKLKMDMDVLARSVMTV